MGQIHIRSTREYKKQEKNKRNWPTRINNK